MNVLYTAQHGSSIALYADPLTSVHTRSPCITTGYVPTRTMTAHDADL